MNSIAKTNTRKKPAGKTTVSKSEKVARTGAKRKVAPKSKAGTKKKAVAAKAKALKTKAAKKTKKEVIGRPTKYLKEYAEQARKLCLLGYTDIELAEFFDVSEATLHNWKKRSPIFLESLKQGKAVADAEVAEGLYQRACGYEHNDIHISNYQGGITKTEIVKKYPPDTGAITMWLKNRQGLLWRDARDVNIGSQQDNPLMILARAIQGTPLLPAKQIGKNDVNASKK